MRQLTTHYESSARVAAPVDQVWAEVGSLQRILRHGHRFADFESAPDGSSANITGFLSVGAIRWQLGGVATLCSIDPRHHLEWMCDIPRHAFRVICKLQLKQVTNDETAVSYEVVGSMPRKSPLHVPLWKVLSADLETYADRFVDRVGTLSEQHIRARRQLGDDSTDGR